MDALSLRRRGKRVVPKSSSSKTPFQVGPHIGLSSNGHPGEFRLNGNQMEAIESLYNSTPAIAAARSVLHGQLLSGGIVLRRNGTDVKLRPEFERYLSTKWLSFAADSLDSLLKWGLVAVAYDEDLDLKRRRKASENVLCPIVPPRECIDIAYIAGGLAGYSREYIVYNLAPSFGNKRDENARVFIRESPDAAGNILSPMSKCFELASFVTALTELALTSEITLARPRVWTQARQERGNSGNDAGNLFFDQESREVQNDLDVEGNRHAAQALNMQSQLARIINNLQTRGNEGPNHVKGSMTGNSVASGKHSHIPPEVPPAIFSLPRDQEVASTAGQMPQARGDLESLQRLAVELYGASFGVPADLLFNGRFASKNTSQLALLNSTVTSLAKSLNEILTAAYSDIYGTDGDTTLELITAPLAATEEVVALHAAGLAPVEVAVPAVLHAIGASKEAIEKAVAEAVKAKDELKGHEDTSKNDEKRSRDSEHKAGEKRLVIELQQASANLERTKAETNRLKAPEGEPSDEKQKKQKK